MRQQYHSVHNTAFYSSRVNEWFSLPHVNNVNTQTAYVMQHVNDLWEEHCSLIHRTDFSLHGMLFTFSSDVFREVFQFQRVLFDNSQPCGGALSCNQVQAKR